MGNIVIDFWVFIIIIMIALTSGMISVSILKAGSDADDYVDNYILGWLSAARSIMTKDQIDKADKMMDRKYSKKLVENNGL